jgi:hypothetical protein
MIDRIETKTDGVESFPRFKLKRKSHACSLVSARFDRKQLSTRLGARHRFRRPLKIV